MSCGKQSYLLFVLAGVMFITGISHASLIDLKWSKEETFLKYKQLFNQSFKENCSPGTEISFWRKYTKFKRRGHYIPVTLGGKVDKETINKFMPMMVDKQEWLKGLMKKLKKTKSLKPPRKKLRQIKIVFKKLLLLKEKIYEERNYLKRNNMLAQSRRLYLNLEYEFGQLLDQIPFLLNYGFPVNHLQLRREYDSYKDVDNPTWRKKSNEIYFHRRIVQDGVVDFSSLRSDMFLRAMLDTIFLDLKESNDFITENLRFDLASAIKSIDRLLKLKVRTHLKNIQRWLNTTIKIRKFYESIINDRVRFGQRLISAEEYINSRNAFSHDLQDFVLLKQADVYSFWSKQDELMRFLVIMDMILFNEVGGFEGKNYVERMDVGRVVINRKFMTQYNRLTNKDRLVDKLSHLGVKKLDTFKWLNVMFKKGEFSFTYFFISANIRIFCPDRTKKGWRLRRRNLEIAWDLLSKSQIKFLATRYFSRVSMLGRIDMGKVWKNYEAIPDRRGRLVKNDTILLKLYKKGRYKYLRNFYDELGNNKVVEIRGRSYVIPLKKKSTFYHYRNPHFFRYFKPIVH